MSLSNEQKFALTSVRDRFLAGEDVDISLMHLIQDVAGFTGKDGRSKEGRAVKAYLSEIDFNAIPASEYQKVDKPELSDEQKERWPVATHAITLKRFFSPPYLDLAPAAEM